MAPRSSDDSNDSEGGEEDFETKTPPILNVDDPVVRNELKKVWRRVNEVAANAHKAINDLAIHHVADEAAFDRLEDHVAGMKESISKHATETTTAIKEIHAAQKSDGEKKTQRVFGLAGLAVSIIAGVIGVYIAIRNDISDLRGKQENLRERVESVDRTMDKIDGKVDKMGDKLDRALSRGIRPAAPAPDPDTE